MQVLIDSNKKQPQTERELSFGEVAKITQAAFFGVQSSRNSERDFSRGKMSHFIWMGLALGILFVLVLVGVVQLVLRFAA